MTEILFDETWGIKLFRASNYISNDFHSLIKYYILIMQSSKLYLHRCKRCDKLFVRPDKKKSSFCQGSYCELFPEETSITRHEKQLEEFEYLNQCEKVRKFFHKRKERGLMTQEEYQEWWTEAKRRRNNITHMNYPEQPFIDWLNEQKQNAIEELKKKNEK